MIGRSHLTASILVMALMPCADWFALNTTSSIAQAQKIRIQIRNVGQPNIFRLEQRGFGPDRRDADRVEPPIVPPPPPLPSRVPLEDRKLEDLVSRLASGNYRERVDATRTLKRKGGVKTARRMQTAAQSESPELSMRALSVLEAIFLCSDRAANEVAEVALEDLAADPTDELGLQASSILENHSQLRSERARVDLMNLGLKIEYRTDILSIDDVTGELIPTISHIIIPRAWKGGEEGLKKIPRLGSSFPIYVLTTCPVAPERAIEIFDKVAPELHVERRSSAQLGVNASRFNNPEKGVMLGLVQPGKAAANAGLRANDIILSLDGEEVNNFEQLVALLEQYEPGDVVKVVRTRQVNLEDTETVEVTLQGW